MNKNAIHIQLYKPHFTFGINLVKGLKGYAKDIENFDIFLFFDTKEDIKEFKNVSPSNSGFTCVSLEEVLNRGFADLRYKENYNTVHKNIKNNKSVFSHWGSSSNHNRKWLCIKRSYGILEIERRGYDHVWCMDAESFPLTEFKIQDIFSSNLKKDIVSVSDYGGWNDRRIAIDIFKYDTKEEETRKVIQSGIRINDFWLINLRHFKAMIVDLMSKHRKPVSYFILGCEQAAYETYLYYNYLKGNIDVDCINFSENDFKGIIDYMPQFGVEAYCYIHWLFSYVLSSPGINLEKFTKKVNELYFDRILCYRGDMLKQLEQYPNGKTLASGLNLKFAVSNYQGV